jgi:hypothetical protein
VPAPRLRSRLRPTLPSGLYVIGVAVLAAVGFAGDSAWPILLAAALALPASLVTMPAFYVVYGLLAQVPGANPDHAGGGSRMAVHGTVVTWSYGDPAAWFTHTTDVLGVLLITAAAVVDVAIVRALARRRQAGVEDPV